MPRLAPSREQENYAEALACAFDVVTLEVLSDGPAVVHGLNEDGQPATRGAAAQHVCLVGDDGEGFIAQARHDGFVYWCSDWARIDELVAAGALRVREGGPGTYGHRDFFVAAA
jgi:hypothetical protein